MRKPVFRSVSPTLVLAAGLFGCESPTPPLPESAAPRAAATLAGTSLAANELRPVHTQSFTRSAAGPTADSLTLSGYGPRAVLHLENSGDRKSRVTSAVITLNGQVIVGPSSFPGAAESFSLPISLPNPATFTVRLAGAPGSHLALSIDAALSTTASLSATGGVVHLLGDEVILAVPSGALSEPTTITADPVPDPGSDAIPGTIVQLGPTDLALAIPGTLSLGYGALAADVDPSYLVLSVWTGDHWEDLPGSSVDTVNGVVSAAIVGGGTFAVRARPPRLSISPTELTFSVKPGATQSLQVQVSNSGRGALTGLGVGTVWDYYNGGVYPWVRLSLDKTTAPATLTVSAEPDASVAPGDYLMVTSVTAPNATAAITLHVRVESPFDAVIAVSNSSPALTVQGGSSSSIPLSVTNAGSGSLTSLSAGRLWNENTGEQPLWLSLTWNTGTAPATLTITASPPAGYSPGTQRYRTAILGTAKNSPFDIVFTLTVTAPPSGLSLVNIAGGNSQSCGVTSSGAAYCWGSGIGGVLGTGTGANSPRPTAVAGGLTFQNVVASFNRTCGLTTDGKAYCWGQNDNGALGIGTSGTVEYSPVAVAGGLTFQSVTAGQNHSCGLTTSGAAYCWGQNSFGQLGDGSGANHYTPFPVAGALTFQTLAAAGSMTCGTTSTGIAYCWGFNGGGEIGDGTTTTATVPVAVAGGLKFKRVVPGNQFTCGLTTDGAAYCWGVNLEGNLGDGTTENRLIPVAVHGGLSFESLSVGIYDACAVTAARVAYCWGRNEVGELGDGTTTSRSTPVAVAGGLLFQSVSLGLLHSCGIATTGDAYCWGANSQGQVGDGTTTNRSLPTRVLPP
jgi:alpha-tubulin suppressor-like RCC1 family protein